MTKNVRLLVFFFTKTLKVFYPDGLVTSHASSNNHTVQYHEHEAVVVVQQPDGRLRHRGDVRLAITRRVPLRLVSHVTVGK